VRQPPSSAADGTALVLGPSGSTAPASPRLRPAAPSRPPITVVGDSAGASALVRSLLAAGLDAGVSAPAAGTLGPVSVPTVLYRPAAGAAASAVAAVLSTRLPGTTLAHMPGSIDAASSVVVLLPASVR